MNRTSRTAPTPTHTHTDSRTRTHNYAHTHTLLPLGCVVVSAAFQGLEETNAQGEVLRINPMARQAQDALADLSGGMKEVSHKIAHIGNMLENKVCRDLEIPAPSSSIALIPSRPRPPTHKRSHFSVEHAAHLLIDHPFLPACHFVCANSITHGSERSEPGL